jgi:hypothetical protein
MKTINRKPLFLALAGITALGAAGAAQAVGVNPTGLGDALIYPYYTVKGDSNPYNTLLSIVNTTNSTKAVKIRFREGKASAEVLDFNIFLSPYDMWTANLKASATGGVILKTADTSCTIPRVVNNAEFRNTQYVDDRANDDSLERLREGYFEVLEMATYTDGHVIAVNSKHTSAGVPKDCTKVTNQAAATDFRDTQGGLSGTVSLVSPGTGLNAAADATPLYGCYVDQYYFSNADEPTFANCVDWSNTPTAAGNTVHANWNGDGADATSAALMKDAIINEYVLDAATSSATDWIVTFPTKHHYVDNYSSSEPFKLFQSALTSTGSCDDIKVNYWDREERTRTPDTDDFSPSVKTPNVQICWEANIVTFNSLNLFNSTQTLGINNVYENGWARIDFRPDVNNYLVASSAYGVQQISNGAPQVTSTNTNTFTGLPVIGFAVQTFRPAVTSSYAGTFYHRFEPGSPSFNEFNTVQ